MEIQHRILKFITVSNWLIFAVAIGTSVIAAPAPFTRGIIFGGLIVTINFHLLYRTLKKAFRPPHIASPNIILAKYYVRFAISGLIIFILLSRHWVDPVGLVAGLSVVVASFFMATLAEVKKLICKEAV